MPVLHIDNSRNDNATLAEIEAAISRLDGADRSLVLVELPSGMTLTVGGGPHRFVAEVAETDTTRFAVIDPASGDDPIDLVVGGQLVDYPARVCVGREAVLAAARTFVRQSGARDAGLTWSMET